MMQITILVGEEPHQDEKYKDEIYIMFKLICDNLDNNGVVCFREETKKITKQEQELIDYAKSKKRKPVTNPSDEHKEEE